MNDRHWFWKRLRQRLARCNVRRRAIAARRRRIWCEVLEPRLVMAAPVAVNDLYPAVEDTPLSINLPGVISNDTDADGDVLSAIIVAGPARSTSFSLLFDGRFTYIPGANFNGADSFTYKLRETSGLESNNATVTINVAPVNDPPVAAPDQYTTMQGTPLTIFAPGVLTNDTDIEFGPFAPQALTATVVGAPANGSLTLLPTGGFQYVPNQSGLCAAPFVGIDSFTYRASDGAAQSNLATVTISVTGLGDPPIPIGIPIAAQEDVPVGRFAPGLLAITVPPGLCAPPATPPAVYTFTGPASLATPPQRGQMTVNPDGSFQYIPQANFNGYDNFTFRAFNAQQQEVLTLATMVVAPVNDPPTAVFDLYQTAEDMTLTVPVANGVLRNDTDVEGHTLVAQLLTSPANGTVSLNPDGSFVYTPVMNFHGTDSFTYRASDGLLFSQQATVTISVTAVNDAPFAANDSFTTVQDVPLVVNTPGVLVNDFDVEGDALTATRVSGPANGTLLFSANGAFSYTSNINFSGIDSFTYRANDASLSSNPATVTINVSGCNGAPFAVNDSYSLNEDTALTIAAPGILLNDSDGCGNDPLTQAMVVTGPAHGTISLTANGGFTYTPQANYFGPDRFTYRASDGILQTSTATVTLNVHAVNDPPVAVNDAYSAISGAPLTVASPGFLGNDTDVDSTTLAATLVTQPSPASGTINLNQNGSFTYTPAANFSGLVSFTYRATDGALVSNTATVTISVAGPQNLPPVSFNDTYSFPPGVAFTVHASHGVLANDTDADGDTLTANLVAQPHSGVVVLNQNGGFTYTPAAGFSGSVTFTYRASDGIVQGNLATVTLNVCSSCGPNLPPVSVNDTYQVPRNQMLSISAPGVLANDTDPNGDAILAVLMTSPSHGTLSLSTTGAFTYLPNQNFFGSDAFTYFARDGQTAGNVATVTLQIVGLCLAPICPGDIADDLYTLTEDVPLTVPAPGVLANDGDFDLLPVIATLVTGPARGTLTLQTSGSFLYIPQPNFNGVDSFTYRAYDGTTYSNPAKVTLAVAPVNDAPVATPDTFAVARDQPLPIGAPGALANDIDVDGDTLTAAVVGLPARGTLSLAANGGFTFTPNSGFAGTDSFTYRASDGLASSNVATVQIFVLPPCQECDPGANDIYGVAEDSTLSIVAPGVLANDGSPGGEGLFALLVTGPAHGTLTLQFFGGFSYVPQPNFNGVDSFTYRASDGLTFNKIATVTLAVTPVNDAPVATPDAFIAPGCSNPGPLEVPGPGVLTNDFDVEGNVLTPLLVTGPAHGTLTLHPNGSFRYLPDPNANGPDSFAYRVSDGALTSNLAVVTLTPPGAACPPQAANDIYSGLKNTPLAVAAASGVLANDVSSSGAILTAALVAAPTSGAVAIQVNGSFVYTPLANFTGLDSFTYRANDGLQNSNVATVSLSITTSSDQPPLAVNDRYATSQNIEVSIAGLGVLGNDLDPEGRPLTAVLVQGPASGTLSLGERGAFTYRPAQNFTGLDSFTYRASDGVLHSGAATVSISVAAPGTNTPPVANHDQFYAIEDNAVSVFPGVLTNDTDAERNPLTATLVEGPAHGTLSLGADGSFRYEPAANYSGLDRFTYRASDGALTSDVATVSILVFNLNDAPTAVGDNYDVNSGAALNVAGPGILANDSDRDGDLLTAVLDSGPAHGTLSLAASGAFLYTPTVNFVGQDSFTYRASDGLQHSGLVTVTITVRPIFAGHNSRNPLDTNADGFVSPIDAVEVINLLNIFGGGPLRLPPQTTGVPFPNGLYPDVEPDNFLSPIDAVLVINALNSPPAAAATAAAGEGESASAHADPTAGDSSFASADLSALFEILALDVAQTRRRKRL